MFRAQPGQGARLEKLPGALLAWPVPLVPQALKEQLELQVSKAAAPSAQPGLSARQVPQARKVEPERQAHKARHWLVLPDPLAVLVLLERKAQPEIRAHKAAAQLARLAQPDLPVRPARKVKLVRRDPRVPLV